MSDEQAPEPRLVLAGVETDWKQVAADRAHEVEVLTEALSQMLEAGKHLQARLVEAEQRAEAAKVEVRRLLGEVERLEAEER